jgi:hypothetical protein
MPCAHPGAFKDQGWALPVNTTAVQLFEERGGEQRAGNGNGAVHLRYYQCGESLFAMVLCTRLCLRLLCCKHGGGQTLRLDS